MTKHYFEKTSGKYFGSVSVGGIEVPADAILIENDINYNTFIVLRDGVIVEQVQKVSMAQARIALIEQDLIDKVEPAIDSIPDEKERAKAKVWWEYAQAVERSNPIVQTMINGFGLTDAQVDDLFLLASKQ